MQLHWLMGLALLALARPLEAVARPTLPVVDSSGVHPSGTSVTRYLRTNATDDYSEGEVRAGLAEKAAAFFSPSKATPAKLQKEKLKQGQSADFAFTHMGLDKAGESLLSGPQFTSWLKRVDDLNAKNPAQRASAVSTLIAHHGDAEVYNVAKLIRASSVRRGGAIGSSVHAHAG